MANHRKRTRLVLLVTGILAVVVVAVVAGYRDKLVAWYEFHHRDFERLGRNEQGRPEYRHRQTGIVFVGLPGATFEMGSPKGEAYRQKSEGPVHKVTLSPFLIAKYELTQAEWKGVMGNNPSEPKGDTLPVKNVSWDDCQEFCKKSGLSLPTEAQWEYACRAGTSGPFAGTGNLDDMCAARRLGLGAGQEQGRENDHSQNGLKSMACHCSLLEPKRTWAARWSVIATPVGRTAYVCRAIPIRPSPGKIGFGSLHDFGPYRSSESLIRDGS